MPKYVHAHDIGIAVGGWAPDWPDGYGFLDSSSTGPPIVPAGNTNIAELNDPVVNNLFNKVGEHHRRGPAERRSPARSTSRS